MGRGHGWRRGVHLVPDARQADAFLRALEGGATVIAAAKAAGVSLYALYGRRRRDPDFAEAWEEAVERSSGPVWRPLPGRPGRVLKRRRLRLAGWRQEAATEALALTCDTKYAAAAAGVAKSTFYRRIKHDPDFARAVAAALARGYRRLERLAVEERAAAKARLRDWEVPDEVPAPTQDFDKALKLMARFERPAPRAGARRSRRKGMSFGEVLALLGRRLDAFEWREDAAPAS